MLSSHPHPHLNRTHYGFPYPAKMSLRRLSALFLLAALTVAASAHPSHSYNFLRILRSPCERQQPLVCDFAPTKGSQVTGRAIFTPVFYKHRCLVQVQGRISGLTPRKQQGWHIHRYGDVSSSDGTAQGPHFTSPRLENRPHGLPNERPRHWGDLGNLVADNNGDARYDQLDQVISLRGIVGRGMIIHADMDQGSQVQPTGGSGARQAQCVIGFANPDRL